MYIKKALGTFGEDKACNYLVQNNYKIIERNFQCKKGEIDIIAKDLEKNELVFIEVKTRSSFKYGTPAQSVNGIKKRHMLSASKYYNFIHNITNTFIRFDVIEIFVENSEFKINHIKQII